MNSRLRAAALCAFVATYGAGAVGQPSQKDDGQHRVTYGQVLELAARVSPGGLVARAEEAVVGSEVRIAGMYPNPTLVGGTSTQAARVSLGVSVPLNVMGQRGAAIRASQAEVAVARVSTRVTQAEVRAAAAHAFVGLWLAERTASARADAESLVVRVDQAVSARVEVGGVPEVEAIRSRALRLRAHADAVEAAQLVAAAAADLGRWIGLADASQMRPGGDPAVPEQAPALRNLLEQVENSPSVVREQAGARAALARADRERTLARPTLALEVGVDAMDPTLPGTNYRAQVGVELPLVNQRGGYVEREERSATASELRARYQASALHADLVVAYRTFEAATARRDTLEQAGVPAARAAARATEESYSLGRASLEAVLESSRSLLDIELALIEARAARANAWIDVERALGVVG